MVHQVTIYPHPNLILPAFNIHKIPHAHRFSEPSVRFRILRALPSVMPQFFPVLFFSPYPLLLYPQRYTRNLRHADDSSELQWTVGTSRTKLRNLDA